jgi:hypothetical protein
MTYHLMEDDVNEDDDDADEESEPSEATDTEM